MKIEMGKKYKTRDGRDVRIYAVDGFGVYCVHGAYFESLKGWYRNNWLLDGRNNIYLISSPLDLVEDKEDWEIAIDLLKERDVVLMKIKGEIVPIVKCCEDVQYFVKVVYGLSFKTILMEKDCFKLATKEEVLEFYFGGENEN